MSITTENFIFCRNCGTIHNSESHNKKYTEEELKISFLQDNFDLKYRTKICTVRIEQIDLMDYIPLATIKKIQAWKHKFKLKQYTVKLNRIKLIWNGERIKINESIKI